MLIEPHAALMKRSEIVREAFDAKRRDENVMIDSENGWKHHSNRNGSTRSGSLLVELNCLKREIRRK
jgi:hypothetical protein